MVAIKPTSIDDASAQAFYITSELSEIAFLNNLGQARFHGISLKTFKTLCGRKASEAWVRQQTDDYADDGVLYVSGTLMEIIDGITCRMCLRKIDVRRHL